MSPLVVHLLEPEGVPFFPLVTADELGFAYDGAD